MTSACARRPDWIIWYWRYRKMDSRRREKRAEEKDEKT